MNIIKPLYTGAEISRLLQRPKQTVHRWMDSGLLPTVHVGTQRFVPIAALKTQALVWQSILIAARLNSGNKSVPA